MSMTTPSLSEFIADLVASSAPRPRLRMRDVVSIGARFRRKHDGLVVRVVQVHRADRLVEVKAHAPVSPGDPWDHAQFAVSFRMLADEYELLVNLKGAR